MLPFLDKKRMVSTILDNRAGKSAEVANEVESGEKTNPVLLEAAHAILSAIEKKSPLELARALNAAMLACDDDDDGDEDDAA